MNGSYVENKSEDHFGCIIGALIIKWVVIFIVRFFILVVLYFQYKILYISTTSQSVTL